MDVGFVISSSLYAAVIVIVIVAFLASGPVAFYYGLHMLWRKKYDRGIVALAAFVTLATLWFFVVGWTINLFHVLWVSSYCAIGASSLFFSIRYISRKEYKNVIFPAVALCFFLALSPYVGSWLGSKAQEQFEAVRGSPITP